MKNHTSIRYRKTIIFFCLETPATTLNTLNKFKYIKHKILEKNRKERTKCQNILLLSFNSIHNQYKKNHF